MGETVFYVARCVYDYCVCPNLACKVIVCVHEIIFVCSCITYFRVLMCNTWFFYVLVQYLKKLNRQERVVEEVKQALKPHYAKHKINKEDYKEIMRKAVPKVGRLQGNHAQSCAQGRKTTRKSCAKLCRR